MIVISRKPIFPHMIMCVLLVGGMSNEAAQASDPSFEETHAFIEKMIVDVRIDRKFAVRVDSISISVNDEKWERDGNLPTRLIRFVGPANVDADGEHDVLQSHVIVVYLKDADRILNALQHLKSMCSNLNNDPF